MTPLASWCLAYEMSMRLSCDLACARKIINLFIINANDSNCKETQTFPYCTGSTPHNASREIISILSLGTKYQLWLQFFTITVGMMILTTDIFTASSEGSVSQVVPTICLYMF